MKAYAGKGAFIDRLDAEAPPEWLRRVVVPSAANAILYAVVR